MTEYTILDVCKSAKCSQLSCLLVCHTNKMKVVRKNVCLSQNPFLMWVHIIHLNLWRMWK